MFLRPDHVPPEVALEGIKAQGKQAKSLRLETSDMIAHTRRPKGPYEGGDSMKLCHLQVHTPH